MRAILVYALLRAALFLVPFAVLVAAQIEWYVALAIALLFAFAASYVFLRRQKEAAAAEIARMRGDDTASADEDAEDRALDAEDAETAAGTAGTVDPDLVTDAQADADASSPATDGATASDPTDERTER